MKFSFINPDANVSLDERESKKSFAASPPLGILYLASVLNQKGVDVSVLDQPAKSFTTEETVNWVINENPDVLGFSTLASSGRTAALISQKVKEKAPEVTIVFGNYYATFNPVRILKKYPSVDIVVRGEAENTVVDLAGCIKKRDSLKAVKGISFRSGKEVVSTPKRPLIKDLDSLPFPNRKLVDSEYHCMVAGANVAPKKFTGIVSSRGCVHGCRFCSCTQFAENIWRPRSVGNTLEEMLLLKGEGYKQFMLVDDSFTLNPKRVIELCRGMRREKMDMEWICEGRVDNCPSEMLREMVAAGCKILYFGIESANQRILNYYNKRTTPQQSEDAVKKARRSGMDVIIGSFILGAPDETMEEILNTIEFAKKIPIDLPQFNILGAQPGNDLWEELVAKRFINEEEYWETGIEISKLSFSQVSYDEIRRTVHEAFYRFVSRPSFLLKQTARTARSNYRRNVIINSLGSLGEIREKARYVA